MTHSHRSSRYQPNSMLAMYSSVSSGFRASTQVENPQLKATACDPSLYSDVGRFFHIAATHKF